MIPTLSLCSLDRLCRMVDVYNYIIRVVLLVCGAVLVLDVELYSSTSSTNTMPQTSKFNILTFIYLILVDEFFHQAYDDEDNEAF